MNTTWGMMFYTGLTVNGAVETFLETHSQTLDLLQLVLIQPLTPFFTGWSKTTQA